jgi:hypothetical protein
VATPPPADLGCVTVPVKIVPAKLTKPDHDGTHNKRGLITAKFQIVARVKERAKSADCRNEYWRERRPRSSENARLDPVQRCLAAIEAAPHHSMTQALRLTIKKPGPGIKGFHEAFLCCVNMATPP